MTRHPLQMAAAVGYYLAASAALAGFVAGLYGLTVLLHVLING